MSHLIWVLALGITLFQLVDFWTTMTILERGGDETNPFMHMLFKGLGVRNGLIIGKFYVVVLVLLGAQLGWFEGTAGSVALVMLFGIYGAVSAHNLAQLRK